MLDASPGEKLRLLRARKGLTQEGLAMAINERLTSGPPTYQMQISRFEQEKVDPSSEMITLIESILDSLIWSNSKKASETES